MRPLSASTSWSIVGTAQLCSAQEPWSSPPPSPAPLLTATPPEGASARPLTSPGPPSHSPTRQAEHAFETSHWAADWRRPDSSLGPRQQPTLSGSPTQPVLAALPPARSAAPLGLPFRRRGCQSGAWGSSPPASAIADRSPRGAGLQLSGDPSSSSPTAPGPPPPSAPPTCPTPGSLHPAGDPAT